MHLFQQVKDNSEQLDLLVPADDDVSTTHY